MAKPPCLDTHVRALWMRGNRRLSAREREALNDLPSGGRHGLRDIGRWKVRLPVQPVRLRLDDDLVHRLRIAVSTANVEVLPITPGVVAEMNRPPATFPRDPADRLVVGAARVAGLPPATHDSRPRTSRLALPWSA